MTTKMREEFEKWAYEDGRNIAKNAAGQYVFSEARVAWKAWQASACVEREACEKAVDSSSECFSADQVHIKKLALKAIRVRGEE